MKIIVSPEFPNPQPYVDTIHAVAERFMDRMMHRSILAGKLATLELNLVPLFPTQEDLDRLEARKAGIRSMGDSVPKVIYDSVMKETVYDFLQSGGTYQTVLEQECVFGRIVLKVVPNENLRTFANLVAHEMTHMLVGMVFNFWGAGLPLECGSFPQGSSISRWDPERDKKYGKMMEEAIVHAVAWWLAEDLPLPRLEGQRDFFPENVVDEFIEVSNLMADAFGTPLKELRYLDAFIETESGVEFPNPFWYAFSVNQFGWIISIFEDVMGAGAYETLCGHLDAEETEEFAKAKEMLREFARKAGEEDSGQTE